ncbi:hypothetical protein AAZX31_15G127000 [Glycine max]
MAFSCIKLALLSISIFITIFPETSFSVDPESEDSNSTTEVILTQSSSSYTSLLQSLIRNLRFLNSSVPKPNLIVTPQNLAHIQAAITCSRKHGLQVRVRSGGHDYEGLSYVSDVPFLIIDLINLRSINIDINDESAWVQAGATLGELCYAIAKTSNMCGFPDGSCPTVGVGGHLSVVGFGTIFRKYGLAADQVIDAEMVDVNGNILNRTLMGEDLLWDIRGGGGSSFGVITAWKVKLVPVPPKVTIFNVAKTLDQGASNLFQKWQTISHKLPNELFLHSVMGVANSSSPNGGKTVVVSFTGLYLGTAENLLPLMQNNFAELGLQLNSFTEMNYSINGPLEVLLQRNQTFRSFKATSDYVTEPIPVAEHSQHTNLILTPYGGRMSEISGSETPFPHRNGSIYGIQYLVYWDSNEETPKHIYGMRRLYSYVTPYVSKCPRAAYLNYRDLNLGVNRGSTSYEEAKSWGVKYFKFHFERLARVKAEFDPSNFFWHEQSIPPSFN